MSDEQSTIVLHNYVVSRSPRTSKGSSQAVRNQLKRSRRRVAKACRLPGHTVGKSMTKYASRERLLLAQSLMEQPTESWPLQLATLLPISQMEDSHAFAGSIFS